MGANGDEVRYSRNILYAILGFAALDLLIHFYTNAFAGYGYFRDEFYYIACSKHLALGYVDQPPLSIYILAVSRALFGNSVFALRLMPALASAATVFITGMTARKLNGGIFAVSLACVTLTLSPIFLGMNTIYSMNAFDWLLWAVTAYMIVLIINEENDKLWFWLGVVIGLGLMNKVGFMWLAAGLYIGLLLTPQRKYLKTKWPYLAGVIALIIFSPFILWNIRYDFAHLEFIRNATSGKYSALTPADFIAGQFFILNPLSAPVWIAGLYYFFINKAGRKFRLLGIIYVVSFFVLIINGHSKAEYLSPAYPMLFAGGGTALEIMVKRRYWAWLKYALPVFIVFSGILLAPLALPILPVQTYINYSNALGIKPSSPENKKLTQLPQFYADMFGWRGMAETVSKVYTSLSPSDQKKAVVYAQNYGEAGAIEFYSADYALPPVISGHNNYWIWGYGDSSRDIIIVVGGKRQDHLQTCDSVSEAAVVKTKYAMPYENNLPIYICRGLKYGYSEIWQKVKHFE